MEFSGRFIASIRFGNDGLALNKKPHVRGGLLFNFGRLGTELEADEAADGQLVADLLANLIEECRY